MSPFWRSPLSRPASTPMASAPHDDGYQPRRRAGELLANMATTIDPNGLDISSTSGVILVGTHLSSALWGISCMQTFLYFFKYHNDHRALKLLVTFVWIMGTASQAMIIASPWKTLILHWGSLSELDKVNIPLVYHIVIAGIAVITVQLFYLHRIFLLGGKRWIPFLCILSLISLFTLVASFPLVVWDVQGSSLSVLSSRRVVALESAFRAAPATVDIAISCSMVYLLSRGWTGNFSRTSRMVYRLVIITINCGVWTAVFAIIDFSLTTAFPSRFDYIPFELCLASLYINSFLANLNSREYARGTDIEFNTYHTRGTDIALRNMRPGARGRESVPQMVDDRKDIAIAIQVDTNVAASRSEQQGESIKARLSSSEDEVLGDDDR